MQNFKKKLDMNFEIQVIPGEVLHKHKPVKGEGCKGWRVKGVTTAYLWPKR